MLFQQVVATIRWWLYNRCRCSRRSFWEFWTNRICIRVIFIIKDAILLKRSNIELVWYLTGDNLASTVDICCLFSPPLSERCSSSDSDGVELMNEFWYFVVYCCSNHSSLKDKWSHNEQNSPMGYQVKSGGITRELDKEPLLHCSSIYIIYMWSMLQWY